MEKEEKMEDSLQNRVNFFHNGKYDDSITAVYQDLLCMGLSTRNVEKVINIVLKDLLAIEATQLPKTTFSNYMLFEATYVAQIHVTDELSNSILENEDAQSNIFIQMGLQKKRAFILDI